MRYMNQVKKYGSAIVPVAAVSLAVASSNAFAVGEFDAITAAVDWSAVKTGIVTVLAASAAVLVVMVGGKFLLRAIGVR